MEDGHRFTVHSRALGGLEITGSVVASVANGMGSPTVTFGVGAGMDFWLTREADGFSSLSVTETPWLADMAQYYSGLWIDISIIFRDPPQRVTPLEPRTFRINASTEWH